MVTLIDHHHSVVGQERRYAFPSGDGLERGDINDPARLGLRCQPNTSSRPTNNDRYSATFSADDDERSTRAIGFAAGANKVGSYAGPLSVARSRSSPSNSRNRAFSARNIATSSSAAAKRAAASHAFTWWAPTSARRPPPGGPCRGERRPT